MAYRLLNIAFILAFGLATVSHAQSTLPPISTAPIQGPDNRQTDQTEMPKSMREMLQRQQQSKAKREHAEMVKRGETAYKIAEQLSISFEKNNALTSAEKKKLDELEKLVLRIRKDLGGSDSKSDAPDDEEKTSTLKDAVVFLKTATADLFSELKKTSRFTISAAAIQSSNSIIRLARFLRLR